MTSYRTETPSGGDLVEMGQEVRGKKGQWTMIWTMNDFVVHVLWWQNFVQILSQIKLTN